MQYDVFISYSRKDTAVADRICQAFDAVDISYFIDRQGIHYRRQLFARGYGVHLR